MQNFNLMDLIRTHISTIIDDFNNEDKIELLKKDKNFENFLKIAFLDTFKLAIYQQNFDLLTELSKIKSMENLKNLDNNFLEIIFSYVVYIKNMETKKIIYNIQVPEYIENFLNCREYINYEKMNEEAFKIMNHYYNIQVNNLKTDLSEELEAFVDEIKEIHNIDINKIFKNSENYDTYKQEIKSLDEENLFYKYDNNLEKFFCNYNFIKNAKTYDYIEDMIETIKNYLKKKYNLSLDKMVEELDIDIFYIFQTFYAIHDKIGKPDEKININNFSESFELFFKFDDNKDLKNILKEYGVDLQGLLEYCVYSFNLRITLDDYLDISLSHMYDYYLMLYKNDEEKFIEQFKSVLKHLYIYYSQQEETTVFADRFKNIIKSFELPFIINYLFSYKKYDYLKIILKDYAVSLHKPIKANLTEDDKFVIKKLK